uniref:Uncharacterized protein n=1 Tax=viral metagenome TaxID=1070528 RepID=A0A6C0DII4_9ZZZZ
MGGIEDFIKCDENRILIGLGILFLLLTLFLVSNYLQNVLLNITTSRANTIHTTTYAEFIKLMILLLILLNIICILFVLLLIYSITSSSMNSLGQADYWLFTVSLASTCLIVYDLLLNMKLKNKYKTGSVFSPELNKVLATILSNLIPILIVIKLVILLAGLGIYLHNFISGDNAFDYKTFFISISAVIITLSMNKLFRITYKMEEGKISDNKFVIGILCILAALIIYLIVLDMKQKHHGTISEKINHFVVLGLFIACVSGIIIFSIFSSRIFKKRDASEPLPDSRQHRLSSITTISRGNSLSSRAEDF